jgi:predicted transport protein
MSRSTGLVQHLSSIEIRVSFAANTKENYMSDIQLFRLSGGKAFELATRAAPLEKTLQRLIESQMEALLGVRFLASEYATGKTHKGRIDSLGLDENGCPVIVEYKRHSNENVINQGLFYLDWLMDHQAEFRWLVMEKLGKGDADQIEWSGTRLLCIASDFTRYDEHAVQQIPRNVELLRYKYFGEDLLLLELVNAQSVPDATAVQSAGADKGPVGAGRDYARAKGPSKDKTPAEQLEVATAEIRALHERLTSYIMSLGDDVQEKPLKLYTAYRRLKNFACVIPYPNRMLVMLKLDPTTVALEEGFSRDMRQTGHWGTGDLELLLRTEADFERAKPLLERSYTEN